jgi:hypothetical protein
VGVLLLGAPWLSSEFVRTRADGGGCDVRATCDGYVARLRQIMQPAALPAAQAAKAARGRQLWRRFAWHSLCFSLGAVFDRLSRRLRWQAA